MHIKKANLQLGKNLDIELYQDSQRDFLIYFWEKYVLIIMEI